MLIRKTRRLNQRKPRLLTRIYKVPIDDLRELQRGDAVDVNEKSARLLLRHGLAVKVEPVEEIPKEGFGREDKEPADTGCDKPPVPETDAKETPKPPKKKASKKGKPFDGTNYFTDQYPRRDADGTDGEAKQDKDKEEDL